MTATTTKTKINRTIKTLPDCKYGKISYYEDDIFIGRSLQIYGEYSDLEVELYKKLIKPGDVVLEVGANIGTHTLPLAELVGPTGRVHALEPGTDTYRLLVKNIAQNDLANVIAYPYAALDKECNDIPLVMNPNPNYPKVDYQDNPHIGKMQADDTCNSITIDSMNLPKLRFAKIDVDGCEQSVLDGMVETIKRCRPIIYIENEIPERFEKLVSTMTDAEYRGWWYRPPLYRKDNWRDNPKDVFPGVVSLMQVWVPEELLEHIKGLDEVGDIRVNDENDTEIFNREIKRYERIVAMYPDDLTARLLVAHYAALMQDQAKADAAIAENLRRDPEHVATLAVEGWHALQRGNYAFGWPRYELRYAQRAPETWGGHRKPKHLPTWDGQPTTDPVLVWCEQGYGDTIMFCRYFKHVLARAPNAILEVHAELYETIVESGIGGPGGVYRMGRSLPDKTGHQCALPSLPAVLGDDGSLMRTDGPYLFADEVLTAKWKIAARPIGLCWHGSYKSERPYTRDIPLAKFHDLEMEFGPFFPLGNDGYFDSFASTAAAIMACDLIITVDTSVAHLAGALGKETWLLLAFDPDFRWGLTGSTTPWYSSMRIFRQPSVRNWQAVLDEVGVALREREQLSLNSVPALARAG